MKSSIFKSCAIAILSTVSIQGIAQETTRSDYFPLVAFGGGYSADLSTCNTSGETIIRRTILRDGATGNLLHEEQGFIFPGGCNINFFEDAGDLTLATLEQQVIGQSAALVPSSVLLRHAGRVTQLSPGTQASVVALNVFENTESRNVIAVADADGGGVSCSVRYGDVFGGQLVGQPVQIGSNRSVVMFLRDFIPGLPNGFGWATMTCIGDARVSSLVVNENSGEISTQAVYVTQ